jgi:hypothetical protein
VVGILMLSSRGVDVRLLEESIRGLAAGDPDARVREVARNTVASIQSRYR